MEDKVLQRPSWIKVKAPNSPAYLETRDLIRSHGLNTVCEEAACPNIGECWSKKHATVMILGSVCTRSCRFCNVATGMPDKLDPHEPEKLGAAIQKLGLSHVVITSVDRDDLPDGGANHFVQCIEKIRKVSPSTTIEILTPDFLRKDGAIELVASAQPDVYNHNIETVPSLYNKIRPGARYFHSMQLLHKVKQINPNIFTKSGLMLGLGETIDEVLQVMDDMRAAGVDFITIGQYLQPTPNHAKVERYPDLEEFEYLARIAKVKGFLMVSSSPLTRSSYHAQEDFKKMQEARLHSNSKKMLPKLKDIDKAKPSFIQESSGIITFILKKLKPILLLIFCIMIIGLNSTNPRAERFRITGMEIASNLYSILNKPIEFFSYVIFNIDQALNAHNILPSLKAENEELRLKIEEYKEMEHENKRLRHLLQFANHSIYSPIAAKVVSESFNGSKSRFLINAGSSSGISEGMPVLNEHGLIGRVVEVSEDSARVMALQDEQSNIPAIIKQVNKRCIVSGSSVLNKSEIKIKYLKTDDLEEGMDVLTSGDGDLLPKNLHIGSVSKHKGFVVPAFKLENLDYVLILKSKQ